jgi:hypothetical protein
MRSDKEAGERAGARTGGPRAHDHGRVPLPGRARR